MSMRTRILATLITCTLAVFCQQPGTTRYGNLLPTISGTTTVGTACTPGPAIFDPSTGKLYSCQQGVYALIPSQATSVQTYFFVDAASGVSTYKRAIILGQYTPSTAATVSTAITGTGIVASWITDSGFPGTTIIPDGTIHLHIHANRLATGSGTVDVTPQIYTRTAGGTETLIATLENTGNLTAGVVEYDLQGVILQPIAITALDRIVVKFSATATATRTVVLTYDGTGANETFSRIEMPYSNPVVSAISPEKVFYTGGLTPATLATGSDIGGVANYIRTCSVNITNPVTLTGISFLVGTVASTGKVIVSLYDASGNLLANSDTAGTTAGSASVFQAVPFTALYYVPRPGRYFVGVQLDGNLTSLRLQPAGVHPAGNITNQTFGTPGNISAPSSFTTLTCPVAATY